MTSALRTLSRSGSSIIPTPRIGPPRCARRQEVEALRPTAMAGEGTDVRQGEAGEARPEVLVAGAQDRRPFGQLVVVRRIDEAHLHRTTLPRRSAAQRRTAPNSSATASMQRARSPPTSSSVSVRSSAAEAQPVGQAAGALVDAGAAVDVEEVHGLQQFAARLLQRVGDGIGRVPVLHHEGQVDVGGGEAADRPAHGDPAGHLLLVEEQAEVDLEPADPPGRGAAARGAGQVESCRRRRGRSPPRSRW